MSFGSDANNCVRRKFSPVLTYFKYCSVCDRCVCRSLEGNHLKEVNLEKKSLQSGGSVKEIFAPKYIALESTAI